MDAKDLLNIDWLSNEIEHIYLGLGQCTEEAQLSALVEADAKAALDEARVFGLASGTIEGKNADLREASARQVLSSLYDDLSRAEQENRAKQDALALARIDVEYIRILLRVAELAAALKAN